MVVVPKYDGSPRRTVDLQALNRASLRQTHHTNTLFMLASRVPNNTKKTTLDSWNGLSLHPKDSHYTTIITQQGFLQILEGAYGLPGSWGHLHAPI